MKNFNFILQSKGGSGKSLLTYLLALKNEQNESAYFIDFDSSVKSSSQQLKFLQGKKPSRFAVLSLLDDRDKIDRQLLFDYFLELSKRKYDDFYFDFGAPESDQFPSLFTKDYNADEFKQIEQELQVNFIFNIVLAGGSAYEPCTTFLKRIVDALNGMFTINIYINKETFQNHTHLIEEINKYAHLNREQLNVKAFGDFDVTTSPHKNILKKIEEGRGMDAYAFVEKIKITKELSNL